MEGKIFPTVFFDSTVDTAFDFTIPVPFNSFAQFSARLPDIGLAVEETGDFVDDARFRLTFAAGTVIILHDKILLAVWCVFLTSQL